MKKNSLVLFSSRPALGGVALFPLSAGRVAILEDRKNPFVIGTGDGEISVEMGSFELFEVMFVLSLEAEALAIASVLEGDEWKVEVRKFSLGDAGDYVEEFGRLVQGELEAIQANLTTPKKKKRARKTGG